MSTAFDEFVGNRLSVIFMDPFRTPQLKDCLPLKCLYDQNKCTESGCNGIASNCVIRKQNYANALILLHFWLHQMVSEAKANLRQKRPSLAAVSLAKINVAIKKNETEVIIEIPRTKSLPLEDALTTVVEECEKMLPQYSLGKN